MLRAATSSRLELLTTGFTGTELDGTGLELLGAGVELDGAGAELLGAGAELDGAGAELLGAGAELDDTGTELLGAGAELDGAGAELPGAGAELDRAGAELLGAGVELGAGAELPADGAELATSIEATGAPPPVCPACAALWLLASRYASACTSAACARSQILSMYSVERSSRRSLSTPTWSAIRQ